MCLLKLAYDVVLRSTIYHNGSKFEHKQWKFLLLMTYNTGSLQAALRELTLFTFLTFYSVYQYVLKKFHLCSDFLLQIDCIYVYQQESIMPFWSIFLFLFGQLPILIPLCSRLAHWDRRPNKYFDWLWDMHS